MSTNTECLIKRWCIDIEKYTYRPLQKAAFVDYVHTGRRLCKRHVSRSIKTFHVDENYFLKWIFYNDTNKSLWRLINS